MKLNGIEFGHCWGASGVQGFFGEGYSYHRAMPGLRFAGMTFVAKSCTIEPRAGNVALTPEYRTRLRSSFGAVRLNSRKGAVLNAIGLANPGAEALLRTGLWQARTEPFVLSFATVGERPFDRVDEVAAFAKLLGPFLKDFRAPVALQINVSCPNVFGVASKQAVGALDWELARILEAAAPLKIPLLPKITVLVEPWVVRSVESHPAMAGLCLSNSLPWGALPHRIPWSALFPPPPGVAAPAVSYPPGEDATAAHIVGPSPLAHLGGGGLSGAPLLPLVVEWLDAAYQQGVRLPINAGGGILRRRDIRTLAQAGADSVFLGSIALLRGWRVAGCIAKAESVFG